MRKITKVTINKEEGVYLVREIPNNIHATVTWALTINGIILAYVEQRKNYWFRKRVGHQVFYHTYWIAFINNLNRDVVTGPTRKSLIDHLIGDRIKREIQ